MSAHPPEQKSSESVRHLTFEHSDFNGSTIWANVVATNTHVSARVGHLDVGDEQSTDVSAVHASLEKTHQ